jgi:hypothetical protein
LPFKAVFMDKVSWHGNWIFHSWSMKLRFEKVPEHFLIKDSHLNFHLFSISRHASWFRRGISKVNFWLRYETLKLNY